MSLLCFRGPLTTLQLVIGMLSLAEFVTYLLSNFVWQPS